MQLQILVLTAAAPLQCGGLILVATEDPSTGRITDIPTNEQLKSDQPRRCPMIEAGAAFSFIF